MSNPSSPEWAANQFDEYVGRVRQVHDRCISVWRLIEACGRKLSEFPELNERLSDLSSLESDFGREAAFERQFDPNESEDVSRHARNLQVLEKFGPWWTKFGTELDTEIASIGKQLDKQENSHAADQ